MRQNLVTRFVVVTALVAGLAAVAFSLLTNAV